MANGVRTTHPTYDKLAPKWKRCSDVVDGQDALHKGREMYLPKLKDEDEAGYSARIKRSDFYNATWRTIAGLAGMAFRKPPTVTVPTALDAYLADIDMAGCSLDDMAKSLVEDALEYGAFGLMVDHPPAPENVTGLTVATSEALGLRPLIRYYEIESVINWRYIRRNNRTVLGLVVLKEEAQVGGDEFSQNTEDRYRVLDLGGEGGTYRQRVFRINDKEQDELVEVIVPLMNGKALSEIPFRICGEMDEPPLIDLVDANLAHYQVNADYRHGLHFTGLPTAVVSGYAPTEGEKLYIGSTAAWVFPDPNAKATYLEFTGQGLSELREELRSLEQRMAVLGARMIADEAKQVETLGATQIKRSGENSILSSLVQEVSASIEWALRLFAQWVGQAGEVVYQINRDYNPALLDAQQLTALLGAVQAGEMSSQSLFDLLQRGDLIDPGVTYEEERARIDTQTPPRPVRAPLAA